MMATTDPPDLRRDQEIASGLRMAPRLLEHLRLQYPEAAAWLESRKAEADRNIKLLLTPDRYLQPKED